MWNLSLTVRLLKVCVAKFIIACYRGSGKWMHDPPVRVSSQCHQSSNKCPEGVASTKCSAQRMCCSPVLQRMCCCSPVLQRSCAAYQSSVCYFIIVASCVKHETTTRLPHACLQLTGCRVHRMPDCNCYLLWCMCNRLLMSKIKTNTQTEYKQE